MNDKVTPDDQPTAESATDEVVKPGEVIISGETDPDTNLLRYATAEMPVPAEDTPQLEDDFEVSDGAARRIGLRLMLEQVDTAERVRDIMLLNRSLLSVYIALAEEVGSPVKIGRDPKTGKAVLADLKHFYRYSNEQIFQSYANVEVAVKRLKWEIQQRDNTLAEQAIALAKFQVEHTALQERVDDIDKIHKEETDAKIAQIQSAFESERTLLRAEYDAYHLSHNEKAYVLLSTRDKGRMVQIEKHQKGYYIDYTHTQDITQALRFDDLDAAKKELAWMHDLRENGAFRRRSAGVTKSITECRVNPENYSVAVLRAIVVKK